MFSRPRLVRVVLLGLACLACTGGTFTCESGNNHDGDKVIVKGGSK